MHDVGAVLVEGVFGEELVRVLGGLVIVRVRLLLMHNLGARAERAGRECDRGLRHLIGALDCSGERLRRARTRGD